MSPITDEFHRHPQRVLDRLVDGELSAADRRELLAGLDDEPGGWRRCALAFLEAQSWRGHLRAWCQEDPAAQTPVEGKISPAPQTGLARRWGLRLAVAASWLVALVLGIQLRDALTPSAERADPTVARQSSPGSAARLPQDGVQLAGEQDRSTSGPWQTFKVDLGPAGPAIEVPAVDAAQFDPRWLEGSAAPSPELVESLERRGHRLKREQALWPIELQDGRRLVLPVEQFELEPVGRQRYQ